MHFAISLEVVETLEIDHIIIPSFPVEALMRVRWNTQNHPEFSGVAKTSPQAPLPIWSHLTSFSLASLSLQTPGTELSQYLHTHHFPPTFSVATRKIKMSCLVLCSKHNTVHFNLIILPRTGCLLLISHLFTLNTEFENWSVVSLPSLASRFLKCSTQWKCWGKSIKIILIAFL